MNELNNYLHETMYNFQKIPSQDKKQKMISVYFYDKSFEEKTNRDITFSFNECVYGITEIKHLVKVLSIESNFIIEKLDLILKNNDDKLEMLADNIIDHIKNGNGFLFIEALQERIKDNQFLYWFNLLEKLSIKEWKKGEIYYLLDIINILYHNGMMTEEDMLGISDNLFNYNYNSIIPTINPFNNYLYNNNFYVIVKNNAYLNELKITISTICSYIYPKLDKENFIDILLPEDDDKIIDVVPESFYTYACLIIENGTPKQQKRFLSSLCDNGSLNKNNRANIQWFLKQYQESHSEEDMEYINKFKKLMILLKVY